ncbi:hypothetical protein SAMN05444365_10139 [Micromonospora pattaloongensis]|uniref:Polyketide cyclase / dehydrase and lipid transport n=1 Tax=Micromonospora pattaloongensis TaxID=405436 RepID=A0A1H3FLD3_9ACTN|nr:hypothetical protein [Micromonospora pattaloongensis]SDX91158.1 hypothetical protein SAMN05444365_10139 [Micromonospora pattaloongensis]
MPTETARVERGVSAPPEVAFDTATDPDLRPAWLPEQLRGVRPSRDADDLTVRWDAGSSGWSLALRVHTIEAGGATVRLELTGDAPRDQLSALAEETVANLTRMVGDRLTAG